MRESLGNTKYKKKKKREKLHVIDKRHADATHTKNHEDDRGRGENKEGEKKKRETGRSLRVRSVGRTHRRVPRGS